MLALLYPDGQGGGGEGRERGGVKGGGRGSMSQVMPPSITKTRRNAGTKALANFVCACVYIRRQLPPPPSPPKGLRRKRESRQPPGGFSPRWRYRERSSCTTTRGTNMAAEHARFQILIPSWDDDRHGEAIRSAPGEKEMGRNSCTRRYA